MTSHKVCQFINLNFNKHGKAHLYRSAIEGIAFSFAYGIELMKKAGVYEEPDKKSNTEKNRKKREKKNRIKRYS